MGRRRRVRDVVVVAALGGLLSLGVMGEVSGARTPDPDLYPLLGGLGWPAVHDQDCDMLARSASQFRVARTMTERAQRTAVAERHRDLGCPG